MASTSLPPGLAALGPAVGEGSPPEVSVVLPCLDEADTVATCVEKAWRALREHGISGEVLVADNGSRDGSPELAAAAGARVIHVAARGYGSALAGGIAAARGRWVVMGDADDSYDFGALPAFVAKLREGFELVQGCRLPSGGGTILPGAMPPAHRWVGNPLFSLLARWWFGAPVRDVYCGLRAFERDLALRLRQRCTGMEFATEMILLASRSGARIGEVAITLHPDGRRAHPPHLRTLRDGWRTLRLFLAHGTRWSLRVPGTALVLAGLAGYAAALLRTSEESLALLVLASGGLLAGHLARALEAAIERGSGAVPGIASSRTGISGSEIAAAGLMVSVGVGLTLAGLSGELAAAERIRWVLPSATLAALGVQAVVVAVFEEALAARRV